MISFALPWWPGVRASQHPDLAGACRRGSDVFYTRRPSPDQTADAVVLARDGKGMVMRPAGRRGRRHRGRRGHGDDV
jgi:hypothetical protein